MTTPGAVTTPEQGVKSSVRMRRRLLRWALLAVLVAAIAFSVASQWTAVHRDLHRLALAPLLLAGVIGVASVAMTLPSWRAALSAFGGELPWRPASRVFYVGQLGKYIPGSVWPLLAQMELGRAYGLARTQIAAGGLLQLGLSVLVTAIVGLAAMPLAASLPVWETGLVVAAVVIGLVVVQPQVLTRLLTLGLRIIRRPPLPRAVRGSSVAISAGWSALAALGLAAQAALLANAFGAGITSSLLAGSALLLATALGVLVVPVPAGAGIREAALVLLLHGRLGTAEATALALVSRLLLAGADGLLAAIGALLGRHSAAPAVAATLPEAARR